MSCYINITPVDLSEAKNTVPSVTSTHSHSLNGLVSWLLTTITILGSNHTEPTGSTYPADVPPNHSSSDLILAASAPITYWLLPTWLTSSKDPVCIQEL
ncbi:hypothetical protein OPQ81_006839 [Rhizoctonia solani]|nr:hypothetical protein OPQ81_006839 [Rhizoctonia solani]